MASLRELLPVVKRALFAARDRSPRPAASAHFRSHDVSGRHSGGHGCLRVRVKRLKPSHTPSAMQLLLLGLRGRSCRVNSSFVHALRGSHQHNPTLRDAIAAHEVQPTSAFEALMVAALECSSFVETQYSIGPSRAASLDSRNSLRPGSAGRMSTDRLQYGRYARPNSRFRR